MTTIPVLISLKSNAHRAEAAEDETMSMLTSGQLEVDDTTAIIRYEESIDESHSFRRRYGRRQRGCCSGAARIM